MKIACKGLLMLLIVILITAFGFRRIDFRNGMYKNVCKDFRNDVLVYFIFVDSKVTAPWTEFDIRTTIDSMKVAVEWLESQASKNNIELNILLGYYIGLESSTITKNLPEETVIGSVGNRGNISKGLSELNIWADNIARRVGSEVHIPEKDGIPEIKNPRNKERLAAYLRDQRQVEGVAILFMVNNYYRSDISIPVNHMGSDDVEFAIVSYKYPAIIAQNILNLFGAADLSKTVYRRDEQKIKLASEWFPDDIMQDVYARNINELGIGPLTRYLIGWSKELDTKYDVLFTDKIINF